MTTQVDTQLALIRKMGHTLYNARSLLIMALWNEIKDKKETNPKSYAAFRSKIDYWQMEE